MVSKKIFGLLGYPIKHSFSPAIHNAAFKALGIKAEYRLFEKKPKELTDFFKKLRSGSIRGVNVTIPYKEEALRYLDELSQEAELIGAVNTILGKSESLIGYNTDGLGFILSLRKEAGIDPQDKKIVIIGAGGASRAISVHLAREKAANIILSDIIPDKAEKLVSHIRKNISRVKVSTVKKEELNSGVRTADILINATPVGMKPDDPLPIDPRILHPRLLVCDLIYNPPKTKLLTEAEKIGAKTLNGLGMLLHQGALAFTIWTGREAPIEIMARALEKELKTQAN